MKYSNGEKVDTGLCIYALRHIETGEFICLRHEAKEFLASFTDGDTAFQFREELGLLEHVDVTNMRLGDAPFENFWLDGEMVEQAAIAEAPRAV